MRRLWTIAVAADAFHVSPFAMARELDEDPEQLALQCLPLLNYSQVKRQFDSAKGDEKKLEHLKGNDLLDQVRSNAFKLRSERVRKMREAMGA